MQTGLIIPLSTPPLHSSSRRFKVLVTTVKFPPFGNDHPGCKVGNIIWAVSSAQPLGWPSWPLYVWTDM